LGAEGTRRKDAKTEDVHEKRTKIVRSWVKEGEEHEKENYRDPCFWGEKKPCAKVSTKWGKKIQVKNCPRKGGGMASPRPNRLYWRRSVPGGAVKAFTRLSKKGDNFLNPV